MAARRTRAPLVFALSLREDLPVDEDGGRKPAECLARIAGRTAGLIVVDRPDPGDEAAFRNRLLAALRPPAAQRRALDRAGGFVAILPCPVAAFHPDVHRHAILELDPYYEAGGQFNAHRFGTRLSALRQIVEDGADLFEALDAERDTRPDWVEAFEARPGAGGFRLDLKKLLALWRAGRR